MNDEAEGFIGQAAGHQEGADAAGEAVDAVPVDETDPEGEKVGTAAGAAAAAIGQDGATDGAGGTVPNAVRTLPRLKIPSLSGGQTNSNSIYRATTTSALTQVALKNMIFLLLIIIFFSSEASDRKGCNSAKVEIRDRENTNARNQKTNLQKNDSSNIEI